MVFRAMRALLGFMAGAMTALACWAQAPVSERLQRQAAAGIHAWQELQRLEDSWASERERLLSRVEKLEAKQRSLRWQRRKLRAYVSDLEGKVAELRRRLRELERIRRDLEPWLDEALDRLERFVQRDLPFLEVERRARLEAVRRALDGYGVGVAEKLRRLLEALKAEVEYGAQVEVTERTVELEGEARTVRLLRVGRLCLLWATPDGSRVGWFDPHARRWEPLPGRFRREIERAMEMAARRRPADLVRLPVGRLPR